MHSFIHALGNFTKCPPDLSSPFKALTTAGGRWAYKLAVQGGNRLLRQLPSSLGDLRASKKPQGVV